MGGELNIAVSGTLGHFLKSRASAPKPFVSQWPRLCSLLVDTSLTPEGASNVYSLSNGAGFIARMPRVNKNDAVNRRIKTFM